MVAKKKTVKAKKPNGLDLGANVKMLRTQLGMTTTALAKKTKLSQAQISRLENNLQGLRSSTLMTLAKALKVRPWVLLMTDGERTAAAKAVGLES